MQGGIQQHGVEAEEAGVGALRVGEGDLGEQLAFVRALPRTAEALARGTVAVLLPGQALIHPVELHLYSIGGRPHHEVVCVRGRVVGGEYAGGVGGPGAAVVAVRVGA
nr:hypothetical protein [Streptomyces sp. wa1002]